MREQAWDKGRERRKVDKYMRLYRRMASFVCVCVCVFVCILTLALFTASSRHVDWSCIRGHWGGGQKEKYSHTPLYHSVGGKHTYTIIINKRASQLHRFCNINWQNQTVTVMNADGKSDCHIFKIFTTNTKPNKYSGVKQLILRVRSHAKSEKTGLTCQLSELSTKLVFLSSLVLQKCQWTKTNKKK